MPSIEELNSEEKLKAFNCRNALSLRKQFRISEIILNDHDQIKDSSEQFVNKLSISTIIIVLLFALAIW